MQLKGKNILITGAGVRIGRSLALAVARTGANVVIHYGKSQDGASQTAEEIQKMGSKVLLIQADLNDPNQVSKIIERAQEFGPLYALINNAAIFDNLDWQTTLLEDWNRHLMINLTAPFLLSQGFARHINSSRNGRIINLVDWRALHPGSDHLPYTISKVALAGLTRSLAQAFAPHIQVNGLALGAVLPPANEGDQSAAIRDIPAKRWAELSEIDQTVIFLLTGPGFITGEIIHIDGGRHLI